MSINIIQILCMLEEVRLDFGLAEKYLKICEFSKFWSAENGKNMWNERLPVNIVKFDWSCVCYQHYINMYVIQMEGILEMKSTTHQIV